MSGQVSRGSAGENQADEQAGVAGASLSAMEAHDLNPLFLPPEISTCSKPFRYF